MVLKKGGDISAFREELDRAVGERAEISALVSMRSLKIRDLARQSRKKRSCLSCAWHWADRYLTGPRFDFTLSSVEPRSKIMFLSTLCQSGAKQTTNLKSPNISFKILPFFL